MQFISKSTIRFIERAIYELDKVNLLDPHFHRHHRFHHYKFWDLNEIDSVQEFSELILELEEMAKHHDHPQMENREPGLPVDPRYPVFHETLEVFPIYNDAIALECHRPVVLPSQIPALSYLLKIPGCSEGLDVEHHGFGYHFHYGKVKSKSIIRTNLLLTFNPQDQHHPRPKKSEPTKPPLYSEQHAEGKTKSINVEAIGESKKMPIYLVCLSATEKKSIKDFKVPGNKATVFYKG